MSFIEEIKTAAKQRGKRIVLPEAMDERVVDAAVIAQQEGIAKIILIGKPCKDISLDGMECILPEEDSRLELFIDQLYELRKEKGMTKEEAKRYLLTDSMYFACMLVKLGYADGIVSGACHSTANTLRPSLQILKTKPGVKLVSSFMLMIVPNCSYGENGTFLFSDCGLEQNPTSEKLAAIAGSSALSFQNLVHKEPKVAFLSHSSKGSASHPDVDKVKEALEIAQKEYPQYEMDGELQLDAAIVPEVAASKAPNSSVAGKANVLIFPDLDAGNIGYKLVQRLAKAEAYGPITQGMSKPVNDLSRGCSKEDIVGAIAITALQVEE